MKNVLDFKTSFWQWGELGFFNCYAAVYMYMQDGNGEGIKCAAKEGKGCNDCGNCSAILNHLFLTIQGQWTARQSWSGEKTKIQKEIDEKYGNKDIVSDKLVDFIFGFTGYDYKKISENLSESIVSSIGAGRPVLAKSKEEYRIIIGYDGNALFEPDYKPAAEIRDAVNYNDVEYLYIFGEKIPQKHTFLDFLKIIERVMDSDRSEGIWREFVKQFDYEGEKLWECNAEEIKRRFKRLREVMDWIPNVGHGMQTAFSDRRQLAALGADLNRIGELLDVIGRQTHNLHERGYMLNAICDSVNELNINDGGEWPWDKYGLITAAWQILVLIMDCDSKILSAIKETVQKLSQ